ncbi:helix-turn-helix transcriptional regulator [Bradyrhizobium jicamae]|uniref:winged helix-turn-helix transcriptional regulator n=1 Tax=Bradyrhizobium jicamae TaxID=280332 RepID=UPI001BA4BD17|nr:helix-turn-helix domain-containing protein [Bradyrhizobium jicamae]MBR0756843.1 helix-turn-helix transcriptional regulator [Bradyrhizobium jicamae]
MTKLGAKTYDCTAGCPVEATLDLIDGKWKAVILYHLLDDTVRFNELRRRLSRITQRMLTRQLRELEADGLIHREIYAQVPLRVEYSLTTLGRSLEPVVRMLWSWGNDYLAERRSRPLVLNANTQLAQTALPKTAVTA